MKTLDEVKSLIENLNEEAHEGAWDSWVAADELENHGEDDDDLIRAEEMREEASDEQAGYFRDGFDDLDESDRAAVIHWLGIDDDFKDQFKAYFGEDAFEESFRQ